MSSEVIQPTQTLSAPVAPKRRLEQIDILRGFALLGILLINILTFAGPYFETPSLGYWQSLPDKVVEFLTTVFVEGSFYSIFSFLFGLGFALQMQSAEAKGEKVAPRFRRRLFFLFLFGVSHLFLIWDGDILTLYSIAGLVLLSFRQRSYRTIIIWILALAVFSALFFFVSGPFMSEGGSSLDDTLALMGSGSYLDILSYRTADGIGTLIVTLFLIPSVLWIFLIGLIAGRTKFFHNLENKGPFLRKVLAITLPIGIIAKGILAYLLTAQPEGSWNFVYSWGIAGPPLGFSYIAILLLIMQSPAGLKALSFLAPVGRMALTNYISHSLICTTLFYGYGFGLYGKLGPSITVFIAIAIFVAQIFLSRWWLSRYRFGPLEWVWRSLTYGKWVSLAKS